MSHVGPLLPPKPPQGPPQLILPNTNLSELGELEACLNCYGKRGAAELPGIPTQ